MNLKALDFQHWAVLLLTPCASAFLDYEVNSAQPFSKASLQHAVLATALVAVAVLDKDLRAKMGSTAAVLMLAMAGTISTFGAGLVLFVTLQACGGASATAAPTRAMSLTSTQALARGAVETATHIWEDTVDACRAYADAQDMENKLPTLQKCRDALMPGRDDLVLAASALDSWTDASKGEVACAVADVVAGVQMVAPELNPSPGEAALIRDAAELAKALGCTSSHDAGEDI